MSRSARDAKTSELRRAAIHQYNKAIAAILLIMSVGSTYDMHCLLVCCLLFVSFEGLAGRHDEFIRHLRAGNQLLCSYQLASTHEERVTSEKIVEMFSRLGTEASSFMRRNLVLGMSQLRRSSSGPTAIPSRPFRDLNEASYEIRNLDIRRIDNSWLSRVETESDDSDEEEDQAPRLAVVNDFRQWSTRFDTLNQHQDVDILTAAGSQLRNIRLSQRFWQMSIDCFSSEEAFPSPQTYIPFMTTAESVAALFIAMNQPTFSLDGDLISGLYFVVSITQDEGIKSRALDLLRKLNRREGVWDSQLVVEMHELMVSVDKSEDYESACDGRLPPDIPGFVNELRRRLGRKPELSLVL